MASRAPLASVAHELGALPHPRLVGTGPLHVGLGADRSPSPGGARRPTVAITAALAAAIACV